MNQPKPPLQAMQENGELQNARNTSQEFFHASVLLSEAVSGLAILPTGIYVDATAGGGGHTLAIAQALQGGHVYAFDQDPDAVEVLRQRTAGHPNVTVVHSNFVCLKDRLGQMGVTQMDGILMDLGVSSHQLDTSTRGFSYHLDAPLDMRMSQTGPSAYDIVNHWSVAELTRILFAYGEEPYAKKIASRIEQARQQQPITHTLSLCEIIADAIPAHAKRHKHPAKRTFQAIRIAVNGELEVLSTALEDAFSLLAPGGRMAVITFHSLEDRLVKQRYRQFCQGCTCPPDFPQCVCHKRPQAKKITKKPILPSAEEQQQNRRSRSAKLRIVEKLSD